jgi:2-keto-4-pentenoate hydratase
MQHMMNVHEPDFGVLLDEMFVEDGDEIRIASLIQPKVEAEIALVLGADLIGPGVTSVVALRSIDCAVACLEIIDSRITDWKIGLVDTIADNASSALAVVSAKKCSIQNLDLRLVGMALSVNGELVDTGAGAAALGNPIRCVAWLANKLAEFGEYLHAGDVVLAGALHRAVSIKKGDSVIAEFDRLGAVHARFG